jgi:signal transduction histidine kinase
LIQKKSKQVILNLCKNAVDAMPDGGNLKCKGYQKANRVILEVADTGMGIPEDLEVFSFSKPPNRKAPAWDFQS